jgi:hypothetical protein
MKWASWAALLGSHRPISLDSPEAYTARCGVVLGVLVHNAAHLTSQRARAVARSLGVGTESDPEVGLRRI